jgi:hypothetical protein
MEKQSKSISTKSIAICTALPGASVDVQYMRSVVELISLLREEGYDAHTISATDSSSMSRAKNSLISMALKEVDLHGVLLISPDQSFDAKDVVTMVTSGKKVIAAAAPTKYLNWNQIRSAALMGRDNLELYSGAFSLEFFPGDQIDFSLNSAFKVKTVSSSLMYVAKETLDRLKPFCSTYMDNILATENVEEICEYFYSGKTSENILTSEDFNFCANLISSGEDIWVAPWVKIASAGFSRFVGSFSHSLELSSRVAEVTKATQG